MMLALSSLLAPEVVLASSSATGDDKVGIIMTQFPVCAIHSGKICVISCVGEVWQQVPLDIW